MKTGKKKRIFVRGGVLLGLALLASGCGHTKGNAGNLQTYVIPKEEPLWIRQGDPLVFEGRRWYPQDNVEVLKDSELRPLGEYRGTQFFVEKVDVRPYRRLYTKFGPNLFRVFEQQNDSR